ncbi:low specificity L-threonine aldolase [Actinomadura viridis]|uniref:Threonine aldolase n=1 Tax=Actinomadura viridis TaxID=58110 RepID=A0A931DQI1_9ACTN|nr:beta-eliminating lyase-related protein [Actinomadura viridis]MBG6092919.1 threonine aldolase [Actinomadura viridis]
MPDFPPPRPRRGFSSDNASGAHPEVLAAVAAANPGHAPAYGADAWTARAGELLAAEFGAGSQAFLVFNGTGANVSGLAAALRPYQAVVCSADAHLHTDECGAPARFTGSTVLPVPAEGGLLTPEGLEAALPRGRRGEHQVVPAILSLTNASELGTVYRPEQVAGLAAWARERGLLVHMDGARLANAAVSAGCSLAEVSTAAGVDILSFGGTKNGLLLGEAVVFAGTAAGVAAARHYRHTRKQSTQLASKMRFLGAQFTALLGDGLWRRNALAANAAASHLAAGLRTVPGVEVVHPVQANTVFATMPPAMTARLADEFSFHLWDASAGIVRLVCSFDTDTTDIDSLITTARTLMTA